MKIKTKIKTERYKLQYQSVANGFGAQKSSSSLRTLKDISNVSAPEGGNSRFVAICIKDLGGYRRRLLIDVTNLPGGTELRDCYIYHSQRASAAPGPDTSIRVLRLDPAAALIDIAGREVNV